MEFGHERNSKIIAPRRHTFSSGAAGIQRFTNAVFSTRDFHRPLAQTPLRALSTFHFVSTKLLFRSDD